MSLRLAVISAVAFMSLVFASPSKAQVSIPPCCGLGGGSFSLVSLNDGQSVVNNFDQTFSPILFVPPPSLTTRATTNFSHGGVTSMASGVGTASFSNTENFTFVSSGAVSLSFFDQISSGFSQANSTFGYNFRIDSPYQFRFQHSLELATLGNFNNFFIFRQGVGAEPPLFFQTSNGVALGFLQGVLGPGMYLVSLGSGGSLSVSGQNTTNIGGTFNSRFSFSLTQLAAIPEPKSWAMMIFGFGIVGHAMRRKPKPTTLRALG